MAHILTKETLASNVPTPPHGYVSIFADENGVVHFKKDDGSEDTIPGTVSEISITDLIRMDNTNIYEGDTYGWRDNITDINPRSGTSAPTWTLFRNGIYFYAFPTNAMREVFANYHIDHDYAPNTPLYPHIHFTVNTTNSGTVRWGFEWTFAKGHQQEAFPETQTIYVNQVINGTTDQYKHFVTEVQDVQAIPGTDIEVDGIISMRIFRDATHPDDTYPDNAFGIMADLHYKAGRFSTRNKAPNFYA